MKTIAILALFALGCGSTVALPPDAPDAAHDSGLTMAHDTGVDVGLEDGGVDVGTDASSDGGDIGCLPDCAGKCGGISDGCLGTCGDDNCVAPDSCGGAGTPYVCGCTPMCAGKCRRRLRLERRSLPRLHCHRPEVRRRRLPLIPLTSKRKRKPPAGPSYRGRPGASTRPGVVLTGRPRG